jgi:hypothetical protein
MWLAQRLMLGETVLAFLIISFCFSFVINYSVDFYIIRENSKL